MPPNPILWPLSRSMHYSIRQFSSTASRQRPADPSENATAAINSNLLAALKSSAAALRPPPPRTSVNSAEAAAARLKMLNDAFAKPTSAPSPANTTAADHVNSVSAQALTQSLPLRYRPGTVYAPHDLSAAEARKWAQTRKRPTRDRFDELGANAPGKSAAAVATRRRFRPVHLYRNFALLNQFTSETGRVLHRNFTGLRGVNQRRLARAVRRAVGLGLLPSVHAHPEVLRAMNGGTGR